MIPGFACGSLITGGGQIFPSVRATNTGLLNAGSTSHSVPLPASLVAGELLIIGCASQWNLTATWNTPSGWNVLLANTQNGASQGAQAWFWKIASGSEGATQAVTSSIVCRAAYNSYAISNHDASQAPTALAAPDAGAGVNPNPPGLTPSWGNSKNLWLVAASMSHANIPSDYPDNFTNAISGNASTSNGATLATARGQFEGTVLDPNTFTITSSRWVATTIAIKGAGGPVEPSRILDGYSNVTGAWSLGRQLLSSFGSGARYTTETGIDRIYNQAVIADLFNATDANQPSLVAAGPRSLSAARFDGVSDFLNSSGSGVAISSPAGYIICCCILRAITTNAASPEDNDGAFASPGEHFGFVFKKSDFGSYSWLVYNQDSGGRDTVGASISSPIDQVIACEWRHEDGTLYGRLTVQGGSPGAWQSVASGDTSSTDWLVVGANGGLTGIVQMDFFEMVSFDAVPSDTLRDALVNNMLAQYT